MAIPQRTLTLLNRLARSNAGTTDATVRAITSSWAAAWAGLDPAWQQAIAAIVEHHSRTGGWPSGWQIARIEAIAQAQRHTEQALRELVTDAASAARQSVATVGAATLGAEPRLIASQLPDATVRDAPHRAAESLHAARQRRVSALHRPIAGAAMSTIGRALLKPKRPDILRAGVRAGFDTALVRASTIARTETVEAYRETAGLVHDANRRLLTAWAWHCSCDRRSCTACWAMHGQQFPLDVLGPAGHPSCRCTRLPLVAGADLPSAESRFRRLPRRSQLAILGPGRLDLFRSGAIAWGDLAARRPNKGWRDSYIPRPLADLKRIAASNA